MLGRQGTESSSGKSEADHFRGGGGAGDVYFKMLRVSLASMPGVCVITWGAEDFGGKCETVCGDTSSPGRAVPGAPASHRMREREAQKAYVHDGTRTKVDGRSLGISRKLCGKIRILDDRISVEELELLEKKQTMKDLKMEKRNAQSGGVERHSCC